MPHEEIAARQEEMLRAAAQPVLPFLPVTGEIENENQTTNKTNK